MSIFPFSYDRLTPVFAYCVEDEDLSSYNFYIFKGVQNIPSRGISKPWSFDFLIP